MKCLPIAALAVCAAAAQPVDLMLVLETSPGTERAIDLIRAHVLQETDRAGVVAFGGTSRLLQPLTDDRDKVAAALRRAGRRLGIGGVSPRIQLAPAIRQACQQWQSSDSTVARRAVVVFFAGDDPGLTTQLDSVRTALAAVDAQLYAVAIPRSGDPGRAFPAAGTVLLMDDLAKRSGGRLYWRNWSLEEILSSARKQPR